MTFFKLNIIKTNLYSNNIKETDQFFHQMALLIFKFAESQYLHVNTFKIIFEILSTFDKELNSMNKSQNVVNFLLIIRRKLFEFLINPRLFQENNGESDNDIKYDLNNKSSDEIKNKIELVIKKDLELDDLLLQNLNYVILSLLTFLKYNKITSVDSILKIENFNILLSYIWLLDEPKKANFFEICKNNYISFMILFLQISSSESLDSKNIKTSKNFNITIDDFERPHKSRKALSFSIVNTFANTNKEENSENLFIYRIYKKALEHCKNQHIFYNLSLIIVKSNLMDLLTEAEIDSLKTSFKNEIQCLDKSNNHEYKKIIYFSYLQLLVSHYFSGSKYNYQNLLLFSLSIYQYFHHSYSNTSGSIITKNVE